jgi:ribosome assembly protein YihI (activator of Der GTPase)
MTSIEELERRVTALEAAQKQTKESQAWMAATLGRIAVI